MWPAPREQCVSSPAQLQQLFPHHHPPPLDDVFLDALASLDFKLSVSESFTFFTANASTFRVIFFYNVLGSLQLPSQTILPPVPFPMQCIFALHLFSQFVCVPPTCLPTILFLNTTFKEQGCPTSFPVPHYNLSFLVKGIQKSVQSQ